LSTGVPSSTPAIAASSAASGTINQIGVCSPFGNIALKPSKVSDRCGDASSAYMYAPTA
jgi:hypothetical protein